MSTLHTRGYRPKPNERVGLAWHAPHLTARFLWDGAWRRARIVRGQGHMSVVYGDLAEQARCERDADARGYSLTH